MIHGPHKENSPCMRDNRKVYFAYNNFILLFETGLPECRFKFPKDYSEETIVNESGYPVYARPNNGWGIVKERQFLDNRWVAAYSPQLLRRFNCHINVERVFGVQSVKYLYKYIYKGPDRAELEVDYDGPVNHDEPRIALDGRFIKNYNIYKSRFKDMLVRSRVFGSS